MSGLTPLTRALLRVADRLGGDDRREWTAAMAAETDSAGTRATRWALGCLVAAARFRAVRERWFVLALATLPTIALVASLALSLASVLVARRAGVPDLAFVPVVLLGPLPVAWLLGRMRPTFPPLAVGSAGFVLHQAGPFLAMWWLTGALPSFWAANVTYYDMPAWAGLAASWLVWAGGAWWGAASRFASCPT